MLKVIYSIDARLGGSGVGYIGYNAAVGLYQAGILARLFVGSNAQTTIPAALIRQWGIVNRGLKYLGAKDSSGLIYYLDSMLFDAWVAAQLPHADIFHSWHGHSLWSAQRARQRGMVIVVERASSHPTTAVRLLHEEHARWGVPFHLPMWNYPRLLREIEQADFITVPSAFARESMIAEGVPASKLIEIPFGVDSQRFTPARDVSPHPFRVLFVGQVSVRKGVPDLLDAWQRLGWSDAELWIVGGIAPDFAAIRARWSNLPGVHYTGFSSDIVTLYRQCDVFVFPSIEEGSALVTYEAMACGLPVVTTFNAGSIARDGEDGFIVPIRAMDALCVALERLHSDATLRKHMGHAARAQAEQFPWVNYQTRLAYAYEGLPPSPLLRERR